jgi:hypothetical protein
MFNPVIVAGFPPPDKVIVGKALWPLSLFVIIKTPHKTPDTGEVIVADAPEPISTAAGVITTVGADI